MAHSTHDGTMETLVPAFLVQAWPLLFAAFFAGLVDSMGGGGGLLTVPTLLTIGVPPAFLLGTNKCLSTLGSLPAVIRYARAGLLPRLSRQTLIILFMLCACVSAGGASLSQRPGLLEQLPLMIPLLLMAVMAFMIKRWFFDERRLALLASPMTPTTEVEPLLRRPRSLIPLLGIATYDGLLGPGTGTFFLTLFERLGLSTLSANALTKVFNLASNIGALLFFAWQAKVDWALGLSAAAVYLGGNYLGAGWVLTRGQKLIRGVVLLATFGLLCRHLYSLLLS